MRLPLRFRCWSLFLCLQISVVVALHAQTTPPDPKSADPAPADKSATNGLNNPSVSSEAGTQNRLGDIPVSLYTGSPVINYPLYTFQEGAITIPITLAYNATGLRAGEVASWCGLGWTLQAGGMITRQVRGVPDEGSAADGQLRKGFYQVGTSAGDLDDNEPDQFIANINGQAFKFQLNNNHQFQPLPDADLDIDATWKRSEADANVLWIDGWRITTPDGMKYYFGGFDAGAVDTWEYSIVRDAKDPVPGSDADSKKRITPTAWYLRRIESPYGQGVNLTYYRVYYAYPQLADCEVAGFQGSTFVPEQKVNKIYVSALVPRTIEGKNIKVSFNKTYFYDCSYTDPETGDTYTVPCSSYSGEVTRQDVSAWNNSGGVISKILRELVVEDNIDNSRQLRYTLNYDYFRGSSSDLRNTLPPNYDFSQTGTTHLNRLKLTSLSFPDGTTASFNYLNEFNTFPGLLVRGIDHWGYFNGVDGAKHLVGLAECQANDGWAANRSPTASWSQYGTLNKITLSSGQETELTYEGHTTWNYGPVGGLRVSRITNRDVVSNLYSIREYDYTNPTQNRSAGFLSLHPVYRFTGINPSSDNRPFYNTYLYPTALNRSGKPVVGYDYVKETQYSGPLDYNQFQADANYKVNFRLGYSISWFDQDETDFSVCDDNGLNTDFSHQPWRYRPDLDFRAGNLLRQQVLGRDGQAISETAYTYEDVVTDRMYPTYQARNIVIYNGMIGGKNESYSKYFRKYRLMRQTTQTYDQNGGNPVENKVEFTYKDRMDQDYKNRYPGKHNQIVKSTSWDSFNQVTDTYMRYVADYDFGKETVTITDYCYFYDEYGNQQSYPCGQHQEERDASRPGTDDAGALYDMKAKGMLAAMVETHTQKNNQTLSATYSSFKATSGLPNITYSLNVYPLTDFTSAYYDQYNGNQIIKDGRYKARVEYEAYNSIGMPTSVKLTNGARTRTTYGYNDLLPTNVTQNADLPGALTTQYEHAPLFGATRTIAPNGVEMRKSYEPTTGRILEVRDRDNKILKKYEYKRKDQ